MSFDTSGINALADSPDFPALLAGIKVGYFTRITFLSVAETVATANPERRHRLFDVLNALRVNGECIEAHHTILSQLVENYEKTGASRWDSLNLHFGECEIALSRHELSEEESRQEREFSPK